jgi:hypothetical protein
LLRKIIYFSSLCILVSGTLAAQTIEPTGTFGKDTLKVGEEVTFSLSVTYQKTLTVLFPDSLADFSPFEYNSRRYFPTRTTGLYSVDSVAYQLSTFEIDSIQYLQLPVYVIKEEDSVIYFSNVDSIRLERVIKALPENPEPKSNTSMVAIKKVFNYPYLFIALGILFFATLTVALFFGKRLLKAWKIHRLRKAHNKFTQRFFVMMRDVSSNNPSTTPEHVLAEWKKYLERLERKPISKLTTREILVLHPDDTLRDNLRKLDRVIYGNERGHDLFACFDQLLKFTTDIFEKKVQSIQHGN